MEGGRIFPGQLPRNYILTTPTGNNFEQPPPPVRYGEYNYAPISYPHSSYCIGNNVNMYSDVEKQERDSYVCEEDGYTHGEDVKPSIASTTSAFNVITAPPHYAVNAPHGVSTRGEESMDTNMTASFHASTYSAFSPFASDDSSPVGQSPTQAAHSPIL